MEQFVTNKQSVMIIVSSGDLDDSHDVLRRTKSVGLGKNRLEVQEIKRLQIDGLEAVTNVGVFECGINRLVHRNQSQAINDESLRRARVSH